MNAQANLREGCVGAMPVLLLPGWQNSGSGHWQTAWEAAHGFLRVEQHDWQRPLRGDWMARLDEVLLQHASPSAPALLVAHSLGCILLAAWAGHSRHTDRVAGALLVAPPDVERGDLKQMLPGWAPIPRRRLPMAALVVAGNDDPYATPERSRSFAADWGAEYHDAGPRGHLNAESALGAWPDGLHLLQALASRAAVVRSLHLS